MLVRRSTILILSVICLILAIVSVSCKRYDTYIDDKVLVPAMVRIHYNPKSGYKFTQAGYKFEFIAEPTPPLEGITFYKVYATKDKKPVKDLQPVLYGTQIERKSGFNELMSALSPDPSFEGWYKGLLRVRLGGVYKFTLEIKDKQNREIARRTFNIVVHNLPSEAAFKAYEKARIDKEKKEFERKQAIEKRKKEAKAKQEKERYAVKENRYTPVERYSEPNERYSSLERYSADDKTTRQSTRKEHVGRNPDSDSKHNPDEQSSGK